MSTLPTNKHGLPYVDYDTIRIVIIHDKLPRHDKDKCETDKLVDKLDALGKPVKNKKGKTVQERIKVKYPCGGVAAYKTRKLETIRKIIIHHHAGAYKETTEKLGGLPVACVSTAKFFIAPDNPSTKGTEGRHWYGYAYHFDVPYFDDIEDGKRVVYVTQDPACTSFHTGAGQNEFGIGVSMIGHLRNLDQPEGAPYSKDKGEPSAHQKAVIEVLVRYLQDRTQGYNIANCHVQGHFQHGKQACPGFDFERWIMEYEDESRRKGQGFCYPVDLDGGKTAPFLRAPGEETDRFKKYVLNTHAGGSGYYPFGRRHPWHNGVHLFPAGGAGSSVFAVRDGWVIAARLEGKVEVEKQDYGSSSFVLVQHEDPGLYDPRDARTYSGGKKNHNFLKYCSLYMHLQKLDPSIPWVADLQKRDKARYDQMMKDPAVARHFSHIAVPVRAGELIGRVGLHNPFAGRPAGAPAKVAKVFEAKNHAVLHFEMFSAENLVKRFDPDSKVHAQWTVSDTDANALAESADQHLKKLKGFAKHVDSYKKVVEKVEADDPEYRDPSVFHAHLEEGLISALSCVIAEHISEWKADWRPVLDRWFRDWGLTKKEAKKAVGSALDVVRSFQWWNQVAAVESGYPNKTGLSKRPFFYHPIRLLNWLNGLQRTLNAPLSGNVWADLPGTAVTSEASKAGSAIVVMGPKTDPRRLQKGMITLAPDTRHEITAVESVTKKVTTTAGGKAKTKTVLQGYRVTISPELGEDIGKGQRLSLGRYGWHWEAKFAWDNKVD